MRLSQPHEANPLPPSGVLVLDKPAGRTSAWVVGAVKRLLPRGTKVGHAGTLDRFATGVLLVLVGKATRSCEELMSGAKQYEATIKLGATTETLDPESPELPTPLVAAPEAARVHEAVLRFIGTIEQTPPKYSALKIGGKRSSDHARAGREVTPAARAVRIDRIDVLRFEWPLLEVRIDCGRGTYVRALARDLGAALGVGGYLVSLRRTRVGPFTIEQSATLGQLEAATLASRLLDPAGR
jgi:tRNA pseudouridine55 synthase